MANSYYNHTTYPTPNSPGSSAALRAELQAITDGFNLLPTLAGNGYKVTAVNATGTALEATSSLQSLQITGSTIDGTPIGAATRAAGNFTTLSATGAANLGSSVTISGGVINGTAIGGTTPSSGAFTTLSATLGITGSLTGNVAGNVTGNVTGDVTGNVTGNVTAASGTSTFNNVTINGTLDLNAGTAGTITGLAAPTADSDAANKAYVDQVAQGLDAKASVRVATTANITLSGTQTIDGVVVVAGERVLVKDQATAAQNGIYVAAAGAWARAADADTWDELVKAFVFVERGTANGNNGWLCTVEPGGSLGSTAVTWVQFSGAGQITAGAGMTKVGNTLNVGTASAARIVVNGDDIDLAATGITAGTYRSLTIDVYGRATGGTNPTTLSGYGITDAYTRGEIDTLFGSTTSAATSASNAATSATNAANSATAAGNSATNAANSAATALSHLQAFRGQYLGAQASNPTVDGNGAALTAGDLYFNTAVNEMRVWNGSGWVAAYLPASGYLALSGGTMTGAITFAGSQTWPTFNQNTTGTASNVTGTVAVANGGTGATTAANARTNLGATTVGGNLFTLTNPGAITFPRFNADNTVSALNATDFRTAIGAGAGDVTLTGTQTLTNKTIEAGTFTNGYTEETVTANTGTAYTIDLANGTVQILTLTGNCTFTFPTATAGRSFVVFLRQDATGSRTVTWPAAVRWPSGTSPTVTSTASRQDVFSFFADGTNWYGVTIGQNYTV